MRFVLVSAYVRVCSCLSEFFLETPTNNVLFYFALVALFFLLFRLLILCFALRKRRYAATDENSY